MMNQGAATRLADLKESLTATAVTVSSLQELCHQVRRCSDKPTVLLRHEDQELPYELGQRDRKGFGSCVTGVTRSNADHSQSDHEVFTRIECGLMDNGKHRVKVGKVQIDATIQLLFGRKSFKTQSLCRGMLEGQHDTFLEGVPCAVIYWH
jgi:hypothetical protein